MLWLGGLSRFWGPVRAHPKRYPAPGRGGCSEGCAHQHRPRGCDGLALGYPRWGGASSADPPGSPPRSAGKPSRAGDTFLAALPGEGRAKSISLELSGPDPAAEAAAEGVNGAERGLVPPQQRGGVRFDTPFPSPPTTSSQAAPSLFVRFRKAAAIKMHCSISAPSAPEPEQNPRSCRSQQP